MLFEEEYSSDNDASDDAVEALVDVPDADEEVDCSTSTLNKKWIEAQVQASIFYVEPVRHVTYQVLHADESGVLTHVETFVDRLAVPNIVGRLDIARIIKRARFAPGAHHRPNSAFVCVYNVHLTLSQLAAYVRSPPSFNFVTVLPSPIMSYTFKPTLACFHSLNSVHVVLRRLPAHTRTVRVSPPPTPDTGGRRPQRSRRSHR
jgi:hypothetical protein